MVLLLRSGRVYRWCSRRFLGFITSLVGRTILEGDMFGLLDCWLFDDRIGLLDQSNILNLFNFRFNEKLILLIVHYFIYYIPLTRQCPNLILFILWIVSLAYLTNKYSEFIFFEGLLFISKFYRKK